MTKLGGVVHGDSIGNKEDAITGEGLRYDDGKLRFDLIPPVILMELAEVYTKGAKKYADRNWQKGMKWSKCYAPIMRHMMKWAAGEECDPEDGLSHLMHAAWGCFALREYETTHRELDDRDKNIPLPVRFSGINTSPTEAAAPNTCQPYMIDINIPLNESEGAYDVPKPVGTITRY